MIITKKGLVRVKKVVSLFIVILCLMLSGCTSAASPAMNSAEQLSRFDWYGKKGKSVSFSEGSFAMKTNEVSLSGRYSADNEELTLFTEESGVIVLPYNIIDDQLMLCYCGKELYFTKADSQDS